MSHFSPLLQLLASQVALIPVLEIYLSLTVQSNLHWEAARLWVHKKWHKHLFDCTLWHALSHCAMQFHLSCLIHWKMTMCNPAIEVRAWISRVERWTKHLCPQIYNPLVKSVGSLKFTSTADRKTHVLWGQPRSLLLTVFVVWVFCKGDHTRAIIAYWPSSVSMGTEKPFLPLLRLESYLLLFYFGIACAGYQEAHCCYTNSY